MKTNVRNINGVKNQFEITTKEGRYFQSYNSIICFIPNNRDVVELDEKFWNYSVTTSKHRNKFLNDTTKGIEQGVKTGRYIFKNLNK